MFDEARAAYERLSEIETMQDDIYPNLLPKEIRNERDDLEIVTSRAVNKIARMAKEDRTPEMIAFLKETP